MVTSRVATGSISDTNITNETRVVIGCRYTPVKIFLRLRLQNLFSGVWRHPVADGRWLAVVLWCACLRVEAMVSIVLCMSKGGGHGFNVGALF